MHIRHNFTAMASLIAGASLAAACLSPMASARTGSNERASRVLVVDAGVANRLLDKHNSERARFGLEPLRWSPQLAVQAEPWADELARSGRMRHSSRESRAGTGENLWAGSRGFYSPEDMMNAFLRERSMFKAGNFPDNTTTGNWVDVGHYTQIIWPTTTEVGCAISSSATFDYLVCRYNPAGNIDGYAIGYKVE